VSDALGAERRAGFWRLALRYAMTGGVPRRSIGVALIVGSILNLINQGDRVLSGQSLDLAKLVLTYAVPYCVSTYGAVSYRLHAERRGGTQPD
jgi:hypothetical protein